MGNGELSRAEKASLTAETVQLVASFLVEVFVWGFPNSSGVLLAAYLKDPRYNTQQHATSILPLVGTLCTGIMYCSGIAVLLYMSTYLILNSNCRASCLSFHALLPASSYCLHMAGDSHLFH